MIPYRLEPTKEWSIIHHDLRLHTNTYHVKATDAPILLEYTHSLLLSSKEYKYAVYRPKQDNPSIAYRIGIISNTASFRLAHCFETSSSVGPSVLECDGPSHIYNSFSIQKTQIGPSPFQHNVILVPLKSKGDIPNPKEHNSEANILHITSIESQCQCMMCEHKKMMLQAPQYIARHGVSPHADPSIQDIFPTKRCTKTNPVVMPLYPNAPSDQAQKYISKQQSDEFPPKANHLSVQGIKTPVPFIISYLIGDQTDGVGDGALRDQQSPDPATDQAPHANDEGSNKYDSLLSDLFTLVPPMHLNKVIDTKLKRGECHPCRTHILALTPNNTMDSQGASNRWKYILLQQGLLRYVRTTAFVNSRPIPYFHSSIWSTLQLDDYPIFPELHNTQDSLSLDHPLLNALPSSRNSNELNMIWPLNAHSTTLALSHSNANICYSTLPTESSLDGDSTVEPWRELDPMQRNAETLFTSMSIERPQSASYPFSSQQKLDLCDHHHRSCSPLDPSRCSMCYITRISQFLHTLTSANSHLIPLAGPPSPQATIEESSSVSGDEQPLFSALYPLVHQIRRTPLVLSSKPRSLNDVPTFPRVPLENHSHLIKFQQAYTPRSVCNVMNFIVPSICFYDPTAPAEPIPEDPSEQVLHTQLAVFLEQIIRQVSHPSTTKGSSPEPIVLILSALPTAEFTDALVKIASSSQVKLSIIILDFRILTSTKASQITSSTGLNSNTSNNNRQSIRGLYYTPESYTKLYPISSMLDPRLNNDMVLPLMISLSGTQWRTLRLTKHSPRQIYPLALPLPLTLPALAHDEHKVSPIHKRSGEHDLIISEIGPASLSGHIPQSPSKTRLKKNTSDNSSTVSYPGFSLPHESFTFEIDIATTQLRDNGYMPSTIPTVFLEYQSYENSTKRLITQKPFAQHPKPLHFSPAEYTTHAIRYYEQLLSGANPHSYWMPCDSSTSQLHRLLRWYYYRLSSPSGHAHTMNFHISALNALRYKTMVLYQQQNHMKQPTRPVVIPSSLNSSTPLWYRPLKRLITLLQKAYARAREQTKAQLSLESPSKPHGTSTRHPSGQRTARDHGIVAPGITPLQPMDTPLIYQHQSSITLDSITPSDECHDPNNSFVVYPVSTYDLFILMMAGMLSPISFSHRLVRLLRWVTQNANIYIQHRAAGLPSDHDCTSHVIQKVEEETHPSASSSQSKHLTLSFAEVSLGASHFPMAMYSLLELGNLHYPHKDDTIVERLDELISQQPSLPLNNTTNAQPSSQQPTRALPLSPPPQMQSSITTDYHTHLLILPKPALEVLSSPKAAHWLSQCSIQYAPLIALLCYFATLYQYLSFAAKPADVIFDVRHIPNMPIPPEACLASLKVLHARIESTTSCPWDVSAHPRSFMFFVRLILSKDKLFEKSVYFSKDVIKVFQKSHSRLCAQFNTLERDIVRSTDHTKDKRPKHLEYIRRLYELTWVFEREYFQRHQSSHFKIRPLESSVLKKLSPFHYLDVAQVLPLSFPSFQELQCPHLHLPYNFVKQTQRLLRSLVIVCFDRLFAYYHRIQFGFFLNNIQLMALSHAKGKMAPSSIKSIEIPRAMLPSSIQSCNELIESPDFDISLFLRLTPPSLSAEAGAIHNLQQQQLETSSTSEMASSEEHSTKQILSEAPSGKSNASYADHKPAYGNHLVMVSSLFSLTTRPSQHLAYMSDSLSAQAHHDEMPQKENNSKPTLHTNTMASSTNDHHGSTGHNLGSSPEFSICVQQPSRPFQSNQPFSLYLPQKQLVEFREEPSAPARDRIGEHEGRISSEHKSTHDIIFPYRVNHWSQKAHKYILDQVKSKDIVIPMSVLEAILQTPIADQSTDHLFLHWLLHIKDNSFAWYFTNWSDIYAIIWKCYIITLYWSTNQQTIDKDGNTNPKEWSVDNNQLMIQLILNQMTRTSVRHEFIQYLTIQTQLTSYYSYLFSFELDYRKVCGSTPHQLTHSAMEISHNHYRGRCWAIDHHDNQYQYYHDIDSIHALTYNALPPTREAQNPQGSGISSNMTRPDDDKIELNPISSSTLKLSDSGNIDDGEPIDSLNPEQIGVPPHNDIKNTHKSRLISHEIPIHQRLDSPVQILKQEVLHPVDPISVDNDSIISAEQYPVGDGGVVNAIEKDAGQPSTQIPFTVDDHANTQQLIDRLPIPDPYYALENETTVHHIFYRSSLIQQQSQTALSRQKSRPTLQEYKRKHSKTTLIEPVYSVPASPFTDLKTRPSAFPNLIVSTLQSGALPPSSLSNQNSNPLMDSKLSLQQQSSLDGHNITTPKPVSEYKNKPDGSENTTSLLSTHTLARFQVYLTRMLAFLLKILMDTSLGIIQLWTIILTSLYVVFEYAIYPFDLLLNFIFDWFNFLTKKHQEPPPPLIEQYRLQTRPSDSRKDPNPPRDKTTANEKTDRQPQVLLRELYRHFTSTPFAYLNDHIQSSQITSLQFSADNNSSTENIKSTQKNQPRRNPQQSPSDNNTNQDEEPPQDMEAQLELHTIPGGRSIPRRQPTRSGYPSIRTEKRPIYCLTESVWHQCVNQYYYCYLQSVMSGSFHKKQDDTPRSFTMLTRLKPYADAFNAWRGKKTTSSPSETIHHFKPYYMELLSSYLRFYSTPYHSSQTFFFHSSQLPSLWYVMGLTFLYFLFGFYLFERGLELVAVRSTTVRIMLSIFLLIITTFYIILRSPFYYHHVPIIFFLGTFGIALPWWLFE